VGQNLGRADDAGIFKSGTSNIADPLISKGAYTFNTFHVMGGIQL
jgi:hypothetical protein